MLTKYSIISRMLIFLSKISRRNETVSFQKRILAWAYIQGFYFRRKYCHSRNTMLTKIPNNSTLP